MMRRNVTFVITLLVMALAAVSLTKLADAESIFLPAVSGGNDGQAAEAENSNVSQPESPPLLPTPLPIPINRPVAITDLVPELGDDEKTLVAFQDEDGNQFGFMVANGDTDKIQELAKEYGPILAILLPADRRAPVEKPIPTGEPIYTGDPNFVHPKVEMPPYTPMPLPPPSELFKNVQ